MLQWLFGRVGDLPLRDLFASRPGLTALALASDLILGLSYIGIPIAITWFARRRQDLLRQHRVLAWTFGGLMVACGLINLVAILLIFTPAFGLHGVVKAVAAVLALATLAVLVPQLPQLVRLPSSQQLNDVNRRLRREVSSHESTLRELEGAQQDLESRVTERTRELSLVNARFETALRGAQVYVFSQNRDLQYTWSYSPRPDGVIPSPDSDAVTAIKRKVLKAVRPRMSKLPT